MAVEIGAMNGQLQEGDSLPYEIPFPLGMDNLTRMSVLIVLRQL